MSKPVLITGATGNQGGAVLEALTKQNAGEFIILALTRNATSLGAQRITTRFKNVHVLEGNMDEPNTIFEAARKVTKLPIWGVFMAQSVIAGGVTAAQEEIQGKNFIDSCRTKDVKMLVYSSVDRGGTVRSLEDPTPVQVFASKHRIEQHLFAEAGENMSWFVLRPTGFIEPLLRNDIIAKVSMTSWKLYIQPEKRVQWVSCRDIGHFAVQGFHHPDQWAKKCLSLAGWEGNFAEANEIMKRVTGRNFPMTFGLLARFVCGVMIKDLSVSYLWQNEKGFGADVDELRRLHPGLLSLEDCLREQFGKNASS